MATLLQSPSQHITLQCVSWSTYQALLQDMGDHGPRAGPTTKAR
jgi:hypothetical protein